MTCFGGVAPLIVRMGATGSVQNFVGVGPWPRALDVAYFHKHQGELVPEGILNTVVPAAPDIWLTALQRFGTMSFTEVASAAIRLARDGFPIYPFMVKVLGEHLDEFKGLPGTADIFYPRGAMPPVGERFVQTDLGKTLQYLCDEEAAASGGRDAGIDVARRAFYEGDIAAAIVRQQDDEDGLMTREDLFEFRAEIEDPARATFGAYELYDCGPWCQGPMILGAAQMLSGMDLGSMGHNSADYIHAVVEALKLSVADREAYFGDPAQIDGEGNLFSATPSDPTTSGAVVPSLGITTSRWGSRAHAGVDHPARVGPACPPTRCSRLNRVRWSCCWDPPAVKCWAKRNCRCC